MFKMKLFAATTLFLLSATCFAQGFLSRSTLFDGYACGTGPLAEENPNWCGCYSTYLQTSCELSGGDSDTCSDANIRTLISDFGGPDSVCYMLPNPDLTPALCQETLTHYLDHC